MSYTSILTEGTVDGPSNTLSAQEVEAAMPLKVAVVSTSGPGVAPAEFLKFHRKVPETGPFGSVKYPANAVI